MALAEVRSHFPIITTDLKPNRLALVPDIQEPSPDLGMAGMLQLGWALDAHHLSPTITAAVLANFAQASHPSTEIKGFSGANFQPIDLGKAFVSTPGLVEEVAARTSRINSRVPRMSPDEVRNRAEEVFGFAQRLLVVDRRSLQSVIGQYVARADSRGVMIGESALRRFANQRIFEATGDRTLGYAETTKLPQADVVFLADRTSLLAN